MGATKMKLSRRELCTVLGIMVKRDNYVSRLCLTPSGAWFEYRNANKGGLNSQLAAIYNVEGEENFTVHTIATRQWHSIMEALAGDWVWITTNGEKAPIIVEDETGRSTTIEPLEI